MSYDFYIKMAKDEFNKEMDNYLSSIEKSKKIKRIPKKPKKVEKPKEEIIEPELIGEDKVQIIKENPGKLKAFLMNIFEKKEKEIEDVEKDFEEEMEVIEKVEEEIKEEGEDLKEEEEILQKEKSNLIWRFLSRIGALKSQEKRVEDELEEEIFREGSPIREDMKKLAKISFEQFKKLPKKEFIDLKNSQDFADFKGILKKYNLIKEESEKKQEPVEVVEDTTIVEVYKEE